MIDWIRARYKSDVFLVLPGGAPPQDPQSRRVATISSVIRKVADQLNVPFADVRSGILKATDHGKNWPDFHDGWGVHPNDKGHAVWAQTVYEVLVPALKQ
jgi:lysophospholipase L1-like esterase